MEKLTRGAGGAVTDALAAERAQRCPTGTAGGEPVILVTRDDRQSRVAEDLGLRTV